ncbi:hypothetical protein BGW39_002310 [Mortierella sp. 14UC]|nr:hypothetical protein BGW39_002310 [Mortierella sp. 14UC]
MPSQSHPGLPIEHYPPTETSHSTISDSTTLTAFSAIETSAKKALESLTVHDRSVSNGIAAVFVEHGKLTPPLQHDGSDVAALQELDTTYVFTTIKLSAKRALDPSSIRHDRSVSNGIAAVFVEHGRLTHPTRNRHRRRSRSGSESSYHDSDDSSSGPSLRIRKRDKIFKVIRFITSASKPHRHHHRRHHHHHHHHKTSSEESEKHTYHSQPCSTHIAGKHSHTWSDEEVVAREDVFSQNVSAPFVGIEVPMPRSRIESTPHTDDQQHSGATHHQHSRFSY